MRFLDAITTACEVARCLCLDLTLPFRAMVWWQPWFPRRSALESYVNYREAWRHACEDLGHFPRPMMRVVECPRSAYFHNSKTIEVSSVSEYDSYFTAYHELVHAYEHHVGMGLESINTTRPLNGDTTVYISSYGMKTPDSYQIYLVRNFLEYTQLPWEISANYKACVSIATRRRPLDGTALLPTGARVSTADHIFEWIDGYHTVATPETNAEPAEIHETLLKKSCLHRP